MPIRDDDYIAPHDHALAAISARLAALGAQTRQLVALLDRQGTVLALTEPVAHSLAASMQVGARLLDAIQLEDRARAEALFADTLSAPELAHANEVHWLDGEGSGRLVSLTLTDRSSDSGLAGIVCQVRDLGDSHGSAQAYREILESAPDALIVVDRSGRIALVNGQAVQLFGYTREELIGQSIDVLVPAAQRARHEHFRAAYHRAPIPRPMGSGVQQRAVRKDGSELPVEVSLSPVKSHPDAWVIATIRDLSERRRIETRLLESAITLESIGDAVVSSDDAGRVRLMNRMAETLTGWTAEEARGLAIAEVVELVEEESGTRLDPGDLLRRFADRPDEMPPLLLRSRSGDERPIADSIAHIKDVDGSVHGAVLVFRDVTEARRAELLLRRSQRDLQEIVDKLPEGVLITDGPLVAFANPALAHCLGHEPGTLAGTRLDALIAPDDRARFEASPLSRGDPGPRADRVELKFLRHDGGTATLAVTPVQAIEFEGRAAHLSLARDVTEQRQMQAQLILADRMLSVGMLAAGLAHEINNPLTAAVANVEFALEAARRPPITELGGVGHQLIEDLLEAQRALYRVRDIVRDVKVLSHADQDQRRPVDVNKVLESSARLASAEFRHRGRIVTDLASLPPVIANESRLGQVFLNLIVNAFQATQEGKQAELHLTTRLESPQRILVEIADQGVGMTREVVARLFTPFFTTKPLGVGTGLGLSISQAIVSGLGGELSAESEPGVGSVFRVRLPTTEDKTGPPTRVTTRPLSPETASGVVRPRVLVVDDEPFIGKVLARQLGSDHEVTVVMSGADALATIARSAAFDVIVCDLMMPGMTGMDLHAELASSDPDLARRMVFMTGGAVLPRAREFIDQVEHPCLEKPFQVDRLRELIAQRRALARAAD